MRFTFLCAQNVYYKRGLDFSNHGFLESLFLHIFYNRSHLFGYPIFYNIIGIMSKYALVAFKELNKIMFYKHFELYVNVWFCYTFILNRYVKYFYFCWKIFNLFKMDVDLWQNGKIKLDRNWFIVLDNIYLDLIKMLIWLTKIM